MDADEVAVSPPERLRVMLLGDGRRLAWSEWGPADGRPLLFCSGAGMSGWIGFGAGDLPELGMRLLAPDRPGLGRSDPHPAKTLSSWADDVRELIAEEGLRDPLAVGFSQGGPFALALAGKRLVRAVAIVSGQDDLSHPRLRPHLDPAVAAMVEAARSAPESFEAQVAASATPDWLWKLILETSCEQDRALYRSEPFGSAFERSLREGFARGAAGYARDLAIALGPWPTDPERIEVPVDLWYGARDTSPVHSPDFGVTLASRIPTASLILDPQEGGSILWTRSRDILRSLEERAPARA